MKELIKITIAFVFIVGSYLLGGYQANEKCTHDIKRLSEEIATMKNKVLKLRDTIVTLKLTNEKNTNKNRKHHNKETSPCPAKRAA